MDRVNDGSRAVVRWRLQGRQGLALPLALFGLLVVTLLVSAILITSSIELGMSRVHQDAARSLHAADAALELFVGQRMAMEDNPGQRLGGGSFRVEVGRGQIYTLSVSEIFRGGVTDLPGGALQRRESYTLLSRPLSGTGRSVGAMMEVVRTAESVELNVDSGLTVAVSLTISGNPTISDGALGEVACDAPAGIAAIRLSSGATIDIAASAEGISGSIERDDRDAQQLRNHVLGGWTVEELGALAAIRFTPSSGGPAFSSLYGPRHDATETAYRWGCPFRLMTGCPADQARIHPVVLLDAAGGTVDISGGHGQGVLIVRNGNVQIRGNFHYQGIIITEGSLRVTGAPRVEGAVIALGDQTVIEPGSSEVSSGNLQLRFDRCEIVNARRGLTLQSLEVAPQEAETGTFAWYEVVR
jgi:hypothetical protein